eukprot:TRINITY_DN69258_c0_g1_i1.p2 TRINITY_DN69258_c0_g1~~TRINITY_DN69258_c0_g1_i1.p2  ORF type:complete len:103 (+),score=3.00 TRINITY_DN69258_c0_g1_i1:51-359(+)
MDAGARRASGGIARNVSPLGAVAHVASKLGVMRCRDAIAHASAMTIITNEGNQPMGVPESSRTVSTAIEGCVSPPGEGILPTVGENHHTKDENVAPCKNHAT